MHSSRFGEQYNTASQMTIMLCLSFICNNVKLRFPLKNLTVDKLFLCSISTFPMEVSISLSKISSLTAISPSLYYDYFWEFILDLFYSQT